ncbi:hypothetical protein PPACK8108_LOCUS2855 [Phakopsora pachyrhizi]|uniref:Uncharacterized protein n=1 Tax=Phakopsora pachyrhizi TaxID=170000 RepID=A0AAV0AIT8_PHAPC|nr:hypothetical protein PPACK8108_LOCUS2855 [Phakopsora pachyrhizi]
MKAEATNEQDKGEPGRFLGKERIKAIDYNQHRQRRSTEEGRKEIIDQMVFEEQKKLEKKGHEIKVKNIIKTTHLNGHDPCLEDEYQGKKSAALELSKAIKGAGESYLKLSMEQVKF